MVVGKCRTSSCVGRQANTHTLSYFSQYYLVLVTRSLLFFISRLGWINEADDRVSESTDEEGRKHQGIKNDWLLYEVRKEGAPPHLHSIYSTNQHHNLQYCKYLSKISLLYPKICLSNSLDTPNYPKVCIYLL